MSKKKIIDPELVWSMGANRSPFGETSEALYLTSGFVYDSAEQAEAAFAKKTTVIFIRGSAIRPSECSKNA